MKCKEKGKIHKLNERINQILFKPMLPFTA